MRLIRQCVVTLTILVAPLHASHAAGLYTSIQYDYSGPAIGGLYNAYSPAYVPGQSYCNGGQPCMYLGGWRDATGTYGVGDDTLFASQLVPAATAWSWPAPIKWINHPTPGVVPGYHVNDPSVVMRSNGWQYMYYTALNNTYVNQALNYNWVGFAFSSDGGNSWFDSGPIIGMPGDKNNDAAPAAAHGLNWNGLNKLGAWSPSASLNGDGTVWLYYHTNACLDPKIYCPTKVLRSRLNINGWQLIETKETNIIGRTNVEVIKANGYYWMVGNSTDLKKIILSYSTDGLNFLPYDGKAGIIVDGGTSYVLTPQILFDTTKADGVWLLFGYGPAPSNYSKSIAMWHMTLKK